MCNVQTIRLCTFQAFLPGTFLSHVTCAGLWQIIMTFVRMSDTIIIYVIKIIILRSVLFRQLNQWYMSYLFSMFVIYLLIELVF